MSDSYKEDMKELKGQESTLEQKLKERHRIFQSNGDTRQVRTHAICFVSACQSCKVRSESYI